MRPLLPALLFTALTLTAHAGAPGARWRQGWGLTEAAPTRDETDTDASFARLRLQPRAGGHDALVSNLLAGPVQVRLRIDGDDNPATLALLNAGEQRRLLWLADDGNQIKLLLDAFPGDPAARAEDFVYRLPFDAAPIRVSQGFGGHYSHNDAQNRYAVDFPLPEGTPILAARDGTVMQAVNNDDDEGTLLRILHRDGSMALYAHLQTGSLALRPGQRVQPGQTLARSGNTGHSAGPHLHFAVQVNSGLLLTSIPFRMDSPQGHLQFPRDEGP